MAYLYVLTWMSTNPAAESNKLNDSAVAGGRPREAIVLLWTRS
jgi:hypothetical protein